MAGHHALRQGQGIDNIANTKLAFVEQQKKDAQAHGLREALKQAGVFVSIHRGNYICMAKYSQATGVISQCLSCGPVH